MDVCEILDLIDQTLVSLVDLSSITNSVIILKLDQKLLVIKGLTLKVNNLPFQRRHHLQ